MGDRVRVVRHGERLLAAKGPGPAGPDALRAEAAVLDRVRLPGVVELVGVRAGDPPALLTAWVGSRSLADLPRPLAPGHAAALCLAVAGTLQRLHRAGIVHGAVHPSHVLLDAHGRPVLCGFGGAGPIGAPVRRPATDRPAPSSHDGRLDASAGTLACATDVAGLGRLLGDLLGPTPPNGLGLAARRRAVRWRSLRAVVDLATEPDAAARPSLGAVVRAIRRAVPDARLPGGDSDPSPGSIGPTPADPAATAPEPPTPRRAEPTSGRPVARGLVPALAVVAVGATAYFGLSAWWSTDAVTAGASAPPGTPMPSTAAPSPSTTRPRTPQTSFTPQTPTTAPTTSGLADSGSAVPTEDLPSSAAVPVVVHAGRRYAVGAAGDVVAVGPWRCDGVELAAVLRPTDGTVGLFDGWASEGVPAAARTVTAVPGATQLGRVDDGPGCAVLVVSSPDGVRATLTADDLR